MRNMKNLATTILLATLFALLTACGGGGSSSSSTPSTPAASSTQAKTQGIFSLYTSNHPSTFAVKLPADGSNMVSGLVYNTAIYSVAYTNISSVKLEDSCTANVAAKISAGNNTVINGIDPGGKVYLSITEKGGKKSFVNTADLLLTGAPVYIDATAGYVYYGTATVKLADGTYGPNTDFKCPGATAVSEDPTTSPAVVTPSATMTTPPVTAPTTASKTVVNIISLTGDVEITPVVVSGRLINLVVANPTEQVLDSNGQIIAGYKIAWNDVSSWYPAAGKLSALVLPKTVVSVAALGPGAGMPYLVRPDASFVSFNTDSSVCEFRIDGVLTKIDVNGLMPH